MTKRDISNLREIEQGLCLVWSKLLREGVNCKAEREAINRLDAIIMSIKALILNSEAKR